MGDKHVEAEKQNQHGRPVLKVSVVRTDSHIQYFVFLDTFRILFGVPFGHLKMFCVLWNV